MKATVKIPGLFILCAALLAVTLPACGGGGGGKTLVKVGNASITEGDLETLARVNPRLKPRLSTPAGRDKILENYAEQEMLYQESVNRGLNRSKDVKDKIELYEKILVAQALLDDELEKKVKEYYDNHKDEFERVKISHILVRTTPPESAPVKPEADAKGGKDKKAAKKPEAPKGRTDEEALKIIQGIKDRIAKGEDFGKVAKDTSDDERTKAAMGDLGYVTIKDKRLERWGWLPLAEKAFAMKVGEVSDPIKVKDGYDLVKVTEEKKAQSFDEAEPGIKFRLQADIRTQILDDLKKKYKVEYAEKAPTPETAPATPAPGTPAPATPEQGASATPPTNP